MAALIRLNIAVVLRHILDREPNLVKLDDFDDDSDSSTDSDSDGSGRESDDDNLDMISASPEFGPSLRERASGNSMGSNSNNKKKNSTKSSMFRLSLSRSEKKKIQSKSRRSKKEHLGELIDFKGPKLITGCKSLLIFYQLIGQLNLIGRPLYLSIIFKLLVFTLMTYYFLTRFMFKFYKLNIVNENYRNPIFLLITFLAILVVSCQILINIKINLFDLCPLYKILTTEKLCFVNIKVQHVLGTKSFIFMLIFHVYHSLVINMLVSTSLENYVTEFSFPEFLLDLYVQLAFSFNIIGISYLDLYIRSAFGHWLLALKSHLEHRFTYLHKYQRKISHDLRRRATPAYISTSSASSLNTNRSTEEERKSSSRLKRIEPFLISFDEIQRNLNNMDDHLEVLRSVQIPTLVMLALIAFLGNGSLFLISYHLLADQANTYHGFLFLINSVNYIIIIFFCYSGDRWLYYALSSFVQTVEDEYFMQNDLKQQTGSSAMMLSSQQQVDVADRNSQFSSISGNNNQSVANNIINSSPADISEQLQSQQQMLMIRKKDVLFCHEFLHQFENHLATPWSEFTFKTHLHTLRTFVTLIAAQIIFDHEH